MLALYHDWDSLCSFKVRMCLAEKDLDWSSRRVYLGGFEHIQPGYLNLNPNGYVPTLVHDGRPIIESTMINEYLDEVFPDRTLKPTDPFLRARMRVWVKYEDDTVHPAVRQASFHLMVKQRMQSMTPREIETLVATHPRPEAARQYVSLAGEKIDYDAVVVAVNQFKQIIERIDGALAQHQWLACNEFTLADAAMAPLIDRIEHLGLGQLLERERIADWVRRVKARPAYQKALTPDEHRLPSPSEQMIEPLRSLLG